jgi:hypothetical protein
MNGPATSGAVARGLRGFWNNTNCYLLTNPREGIKIGSIYTRDPISGVAVYVDDLENVVKSKGTEESFEYPEPKTLIDSTQINDSSDFSDTQVRASFLTNITNKIVNTLSIGGKWQNQKEEQLVSYFLDNTIEEVSLGLLRGKIQDYIFDRTRFDCNMMAEYFIVIQARKSKKFALCSSNSKNKDFQMLMELGGLLSAAASHKFDSGEFSCAICPSQSNNGLTYAVKVVRLKCDDATARIEIGDPSTQPMQFRVSGFGPTSEISDLFAT